MNKSLIAFVILTGLSSAVDAQQAPDPAFMSKAITSLQVQRNAAMDQQAIAEAKLAQANEKIQELEKKVQELQNSLEKKDPATKK